jgi:hypothetical protein
MLGTGRVGSRARRAPRQAIELIRNARQELGYGGLARVAKLGVEELATVQDTCETRQ